MIIERDGKRYRIVRDSLGRVVELDVWVEPKRTTGRGQSVPHWRSVSSKALRDRFSTNTAA